MPSPLGKRVFIVLNPKAGRGPKGHLGKSIAEGLSQYGMLPEVVLDLDQLREMSRQAGEELRTIVAIGGDGTAAAVANANQSSCSLTLVPMGTENLLARHLGLSADPQTVCEHILAHNTRQIDVGEVNGRIFLLMFSCGFDADVVRRLDATRTGNITHFSYAQPVLDALRNYSHPTVRMMGFANSNSDKPDVVTEGHWLFAFNLPCYARNLAIAPNASADDGLLDVRLFRGGNSLAGVFHFATVLSRCHGRWSGCEEYQVAKLHIESNEEVPFQTDGDAGGTLPAEIRVIPNGITLVEPQDAKRRSR